MAMKPINLLSENSVTLKISIEQDIGYFGVIEHIISEQIEQ